MQFMRLEDSDSEEFKEAWEIYRLSFLADERRTLKLQKKLMKNKKYDFFIVVKKSVIVGIVANWDLGDFLFIEHLAIKQNLRGKGIGTEMLREYEILKEYLSKNKKKIVLEVERPESQIAIKRIKFYENNGFKLNDFEYIQPPYGEDKSSVPQFLMTYPKKIDEPEFYLIREKIYSIVYEVEKNKM